MNLIDLLAIEPMDLFPLFHDLAIASLTAFLIILFVPVSKAIVNSISKECSVEQTLKRILIKRNSVIK